MTQSALRERSRHERPRILVVEDQPQVQKALSVSLEANGYRVACAQTGALALSEAEAIRPDLILLDLGLPDMDGEDVLRTLRSWSKVPVLVISARATRGDKISALDLGADDYITKPYSVDELLARIRAALRRGGNSRTDLPVVTTSGGLRVDLAAGRAIDSDGADIRLTPTEWHVLEVLARNAGAVVSHAELLGEVWGAGYETETNYLRLYIAQLRSKLEADPSSPAYIFTEQGRGYRFSAD